MELLYGGEDLPTEVSEDELPKWVPGDVASETFASTLAHAGDLNGDGLGDFVVGDASYSGYVGRSVIVYGSSVPTTGAVRSVRGLPHIVGREPSWMGHVAGAVGDVTGDGVDDLVISAPQESFEGDTMAGTVLLLPGQSERYRGEILRSGLASYHGSSELAVLGSGGRHVVRGDINGDGLLELVLTDARDSRTGRVHLIYGAGTAPAGAQRIDDAADVTLRGEGEGHEVGEGVATPVGDLDQDGYDDLAISSKDGGAAVLHLVFGHSEHLASGMLSERTSISIPEPYYPQEWLGDNPEVADLDGDGQNEIVIAAAHAPGSTTERKRGGVYIFDPTENTATPTWRDLEGSTLTTDHVTRALTTPSCRERCWYGIGLASGDFDGDGRADLAVGASHSNPAGDVFIYLGSSLY